MENGVITTAYQVEQRGWLASPHGTEPGTMPSITLDLTKFASDRYPNGFIPSGTLVGKLTATGLYGPYDDAASDGTQTAVGILFDSENVRSGQTQATNAILIHGFVEKARLPFTSGKGFADANGIADLKLITFL